jgi:50S ribosomal subunit-associated GTPase HflX
MKRHLRKKQDVLKKKLEQYKKVRAEHRKSRIRKNLDTVGIV